MSKSVYSNFDHTFDADVKVELLSGEPGEKYQHAAWDFCGYVYKTEAGTFEEEIWRHGSLVEVLKSDTVEALIEAANDKYGNA